MRGRARVRVAGRLELGHEVVVLHEVHVALLRAQEEELAWVRVRG